MVDRLIRFDPLRATACDRCRTKKRKCNGREPCLNCTRMGTACSYSQDGRRRHALIKGSLFQNSAVGNDISKVQTSTNNDDAESRLKNSFNTVKDFFSGNEQGNSSATFQKELNDVFRGGHYQGDILGNDCIIENGRLTFRNSYGTFTLEKSRCDLYVDQFQSRRSPSHVLVGPDFDNLYGGLFCKAKNALKGGTALLIFSVLTIGSINGDVSAMLFKDLPEISAQLYRAAADSISGAIIESSFFSSLGFYIYGHLCHMLREPLSQRRFTQIGTNIAVSCGYHRELVYQSIQSRVCRESRLRSFWHGYTVCYIHTALSGSEQLLPFDTIKTPLPNEEIQLGKDSDRCEVYYLSTKISLCSFHSESLRCSHLDLQQSLSHLKFLDSAFLNTERSISKWENSGPISKGYAKLCKSFVECFRIACYRPMMAISEEANFQIAKTAQRLIKIIWQYVCVDNGYPADQAWYDCYFTFFGAAMLLMAWKNSSHIDIKLEVQEDIDLASKIFSKLQSNVPGVSEWNKIILTASAASKSEPDDLISNGPAHDSREVLEKPAGLFSLDTFDGRDDGSYSSDILGLSAIGSLEEFLFSDILDKSKCNLYYNV